MNDKETLYLAYLDDPEKDIKIEQFPSFAGGFPLWLNYDNKKYLPTSLSCPNCKSSLKFILQTFAPHKEAYYRYIYIFICIEEKCKKKEIKILRCQLKFENYFFDKSEKMLNKDIINYSEENLKYCLVKEIKEILSYPLEQDEYQSININNNDLEKLLKPKNNEEEKKEKIEEDSSYSAMDMEIDEEEEGEEFQIRNKALETDVDFLIFRNNIMNDPNHFMRYCFSQNSTPLFYSSFGKFDESDVPDCGKCGAKRVFEFQINSNFLNFSKKLYSLDWGVLCVYSCQESCFLKNDEFCLFEECAFLQEEVKEVSKKEIIEQEKRIEEIMKKNELKMKNDAKKIKVVTKKKIIKKKNNNKKDYKEGKKNFFDVNKDFNEDDWI